MIRASIIVSCFIIKAKLLTMASRRSHTSLTCSPTILAHFCSNIESSLKVLEQNHMFTCLRTWALGVWDSLPPDTYSLISFRFLFNVSFPDNPVLYRTPYSCHHIVLYFFNSAFWLLIYDVCYFVYCLSSP